MKCNEAYMIPAYEEREDTSVLKMQTSSFRTPYRKHWQATVQGLQKNAVVAQTLTADARVALKVNAAITRIESRFVSAGKFLRAELLQMKQNRNVEMDFWYTFFDDPRDTYRVLQGIRIYNLWH